MAEILGLIRSTFERIKPQGPWVMLSYQRECRAQAMRVADRLKQRGASVWIDVEQLSKYENDAEGMPHAVENAQVMDSNHNIHLARDFTFCSAS